MKTQAERAMKSIDVVIWALLAFAGLSWGLVGVFDFDLVAAILGDMSVASRIIYALVGLAAIYDIVLAKMIWQRWNMHFATPSHA